MKASSVELDGLARLAKNALAKKPDEIDVRLWSGDSGVNCYAFAANCKTPRRAKPDPGAYRGYSAKDPGSGKFTRERLVHGATCDGMSSLDAAYTDPPTPSQEHYLVALFISSDGTDHHWYRRHEATGCWLHKPGPQGIRNFGKNFVLLGAELHTIDHDYGSSATNYEFVSYFEVPYAGLDVG